LPCSSHHEGIEVLQFKSNISVGVRCIVLRDGKLLVQQVGNNSYRLPGGKLEHNESLSKCVKRELMEEMDLHVTDSKLKFIVENMYIRRRMLRHEILFCYICESVGEPKVKERHVKVLWVKPRDIKDSFRPKPLIVEIEKLIMDEHVEPKYLLVINDVLVKSQVLR